MIEAPRNARSEVSAITPLRAVSREDECRDLQETTQLKAAHPVVSHDVTFRPKERDVRTTLLLGIALRAIEKLV